MKRRCSTRVQRGVHYLAPNSSQTDEQNNRREECCICDCALRITAGQRAAALTLVENLSATSAGNTFATTSGLLASPFVTGNTSYNLDSVTLPFRERLTGPGLIVSLYSDDSNQPGAPLSVFTNPGTLPAAFAPATFSLATPQALATNTKYWLVAGVASTGTAQYEWEFTVSTSFTGLTGWSIADEFIVSGDSGVSWGAISAGPQQFSVNGSPVSPPSAPAVPGPLPILGAAACWRFSRKLRTATQSRRIEH